MEACVHSVIGLAMVPSRHYLLFSGRMNAHILLEKYMLYALVHNVCLWHLMFVALHVCGTSCTHMYVVHPGTKNST